MWLEASVYEVVCCECPLASDLFLVSMRASNSFDGEESVKGGD